MKRIFHVVALATTLTLGGQAVLAQDFDKGVAAYKQDDYATALQELRPLAEQGDAYAQSTLGIMYDNGEGVPQDYVEAAKWYRLAAEQGVAPAQSLLGGMYANGKGVIQDNAEAVKWSRLAAEQGYAPAQFNLGVMYANGKGVIQDNLYAHMWWNIAASLGSEGASNYRDIIAKQMTPADLSEAQKLARECVAKNYKGC